MPVRGLSAYEKRHQKVISQRRFAARMLKAIALWLMLTLIGLSIGMAGYATFEGMPMSMPT